MPLTELVESNRVRAMPHKVPCTTSCKPSCPITGCLLLQLDTLT